METINVCLVGCGAVTKGHLQAFQKIPNTRVTSIVDINERQAERVAKEWKVPKLFTTLSDALSQDDIDVVDIATPPQIHASQAVEAMEQGKSVIIEKPMTTTLEDAQKILDCYHKTGSKASVIHNWLFDQPTLAAKSMVAEGRIGEIFNVEVEAMQTLEDEMACNKNHWVHKLHGGRFSEMLAHPIYLVREFLGNETKIENVYSSKIGEYPWLKSDELTGTFSADGKIGRMYASFNSPQEMININLYGQNGIINLDLCNFTVRLRHKRKAARFQKGMDTLTQANQMIKCTAANSLKIASNRWVTGHDSFMKFFVDYLRGEGKPPVSIEDGYEVVRLTLEMCESIVGQEQERQTKSRL